MGGGVLQSAAPGLGGAAAGLPRRVPAPAALEASPRPGSGLEQRPPAPTLDPLRAVISDVRFRGWPIAG